MWSADVDAMRDTVVLSLQAQLIRTTATRVLLSAVLPIALVSIFHLVARAVQDSVVQLLRAQLPRISLGHARLLPAPSTVKEPM